MKKFVVRTVVFLLPCVFLFGFIEWDLRTNVQLAHLVQYALNLPAKKTYIDEHSREIENLLLGSSHTMVGLNPHYIDGNTFNLASSVQALKYDVQLLKHYETQLKSLKTIIVSISYFTFGEDTQREELTAQMLFHSVYQWGNNSAEDDNFITSIFLRPYLKSWYNRMKGNTDKEKLDAMFREVYTNKGWMARSRHQVTQKMAHNAIQRHEITRKNKQLEHKKSSDIEHIQNIIRFAEKHNVNLIFFTAPHHAYYRSLIDTKLWKKNQTLMQQLIKNTSATYLNLFSDPQFADHDFSDSDHLSVQGATKLSKIVNSFMQENNRKQ